MRRSTTSLALALAACATAPMAPRDAEPLLTTPAELGLAAEPFVLPVGDGDRIAGFWLPNPAANGRTVVFCHDEDTDVGCIDPYYTFLHAAGLQVLVFDPRGYGHSTGTPSLAAWCEDTVAVLRFVRARRDVDANKVALFGTGLGSLAAQWAAASEGIAALVLEHVPDIKSLAGRPDGRDYVLPPLPAKPSQRAAAPALFVGSDGEPVADRLALARDFHTYDGPRQLWLLEHTATAPHGMLTHDGEYQRTIGGFLTTALDGLLAAPASPWHAEVTWQPRADGRAEFVVRPGVPEWGNRTALQLSAVLADGSALCVHAWSNAPVLATLASEPIAIGAVVATDVVDDDAVNWRRPTTPLQRAAAAVDPLWDRIEAMRLNQLDAAGEMALADALAAAEAKEPFPPLLQAELADVFAGLGAMLFEQPQHEARGRALLQRAIAACPTQPDRHRWPGPIATYGYPQREAVELARDLLASPPPKAKGDAAR
jgi:pimeloyl-ACP methyl ester carboxylesterase